LVWNWGTKLITTLFKSKKQAMENKNSISRRKFLAATVTAAAGSAVGVGSIASPDPVVRTAEIRTIGGTPELFRRTNFLIWKDMVS
jgi:hypothetical protein